MFSDVFYTNLTRKLSQILQNCKSIGLIRDLRVDSYSVNINFNLYATIKITILNPMCIIKFHFSLMSPMLKLL